MPDAPGGREFRGVRIEGIRELVSDLRQSPERLDKGLRKRFRAVAKKVEGEARSEAAAAHPTRKTPAPTTPPRQHWRDLIRTIRAGADADTPTLSLGGKDVPWVLGFEFGAYVHRQFPPWQGNKSSAGYFFWPAIRRNNDTIEQEMLAAVDDVVAARNAPGG